MGLVKPVRFRLRPPLRRCMDRASPAAIRKCRNAERQPDALLAQHLGQVGVAESGIGREFRATTSGIDMPRGKT